MKNRKVSQNVKFVVLPQQTGSKKVNSSSTNSVTPKKDVRVKLEIKPEVKPEVQEPEVHSQEPEVHSDEVEAEFAIGAEESSLSLLAHDSADEIEGLEKEEYFKSLDGYYGEWIESIKECDDPMEQFQCTMKLLKSLDRHQSTEKGYARTVDKINNYLLYLMQNEERAEITGEEKDAYVEKIDTIIRVVYQYYQAFKILCKNQEIITGNERADDSENKGSDEFNLSPSIMEFLRPSHALPKYNDKQKLQIRLLKQLNLKGYRKYGEFCYEQIKTRQGHYTHAWKQACTVEDFVIESCDRLINPDNWDVLTKGSRSGVQDMVDKLVSLNDPEFPPLKKDRHKFSFKNGIYVTRFPTKDGNRKIIGERFIPYNSPEIKLADSRLASAKYHDLQFVDYSDIEDWYEIPTPNFQRVLDHQYAGLDNDQYEPVCRWFYAIRKSTTN
jgi:hypothetical protein